MRTNRLSLSFLWIAPVIIQFGLLAIAFALISSGFDRMQAVEANWSAIQKSKALMRTTERSLIDFSVRVAPKSKLAGIDLKTDSGVDRLPSMWDLLSAPPDPKQSPITNAVTLNLYTGDFLFRLMQGAKRSSNVDLDAIDDFAINEFSSEWTSSHNRFLRMRAKALHQQELFLSEFSKNLFLGLLLSTLTAFGAFILIWRKIFLRFRDRVESIKSNGELLLKGKLLPLPDGPLDELYQVECAFHESSDILSEGGRHELTIMNQTTDIICAFDSDLRFKSVSQQGARSWQYSSEELHGRSIDRLFDSSTARQYYADFQNVRKLPEGKCRTETTIKCKYGTIKTFVWTVTWSAADETFYCVAHDITQLRKMTQLKQDLFNMIAHDLRAPLASLGLALSHLRWGTTEENSKRTELIEKIQIKHERLMDLVNSILEVRRLESGKGVLKFECTSAFEVCEQAIEKYSPLSDLLKLTVPLPKSDAAVYADPAKLRQIVQNMFLLSYEFALPGSNVEVDISTADDKAIIKITAEAMGAPVSLDSIKLFIARTLAESHGGTVAVEKTGPSLISLCAALPEFTDEMDQAL